MWLKKIKKKKFQFLLVALMLCFTSAIFAACISFVAEVSHYNPIRRLHMATRDMLGGKFDTSVDYDYEGEVGTLCHDFELMRTELLDSQRREQKIGGCL